MTKYEICKRNNDGRTWLTIAQADTWHWAKEIVESLNCWSDGEFKVFRNGKQIKSINEAMENESEGARED